MYIPNWTCKRPQDVEEYARSLPPEETCVADAQQCRNITNPKHRYFYCTREVGHDGPHIAAYGKGQWEPRAVWYEDPSQN